MQPRTSCIALAVSSALLAAAPAHGAWTAPVELGAGERASELVHVAVNARGDAAFAWTSAGTVRARTRSRDGVLGAVRTLAAGERGQGVHVGIDGDGDAVVAWERYDTRESRVRARVLRVSGALGPALTLSPRFGAAWLDELAVAPSGRAIVSWSQQGAPRDGIYAAAIRPDGRRGSVRRVSGPREISTSMSSVAINARGQAAYAWIGQDRGPSGLQVRARTQAADGRLRPIATLSTPNEVSQVPRVAIDARGRALVAWRLEYFAGRLAGTASGLRARSLAPSGRRGPLVTVSARGEHVEEDFALAIRPQGDAVAVWSGRQRGLGLRPIAPGVRLGVIARLQEPGAFMPAVGLSDAGEAVVTWLDGRRLRDRVVARTRSAAGELGPPTVLSDPRREAVGPALGVDAAGRAVVAWRVGPTPLAAFGP